MNVEEEIWLTYEPVQNIQLIGDLGYNALKDVLLEDVI